MQIAELVLEYIKVAVWPLLALVVVLMFRRALAERIRNVQSAHLMGAELHFYQQMAVAEQIDGIAARAAEQPPRPPVPVPDQYAQAPPQPAPFSWTPAPPTQPSPYPSAPIQPTRSFAPAPPTDRSGPPSTRDEDTETAVEEEQPSAAGGPGMRNRNTGGAAGGALNSGVGSGSTGGAGGSAAGRSQAAGSALNFHRPDGPPGPPSTVGRQAREVLAALPPSLGAEDIPTDRRGVEQVEQRLQDILSVLLSRFGYGRPAGAHLTEAAADHLTTVTHVTGWRDLADVWQKLVDSLPSWAQTRRTLFSEDRGAITFGTGLLWARNATRLEHKLRELLEATVEANP